MTDMRALFAPNQFVICPRYGRNMTWRLQLHQCLNHIKTNWYSLSLSTQFPSVQCMVRSHSSYFVIRFNRFGSSATTAGKAHKCITMLWPRNAWTVNPTTLAKREAEQVALVASDLILAVCHKTRNKGLRTLFWSPGYISGNCGPAIVFCWKPVAECTVFLLETRGWMHRCDSLFVSVFLFLFYLFIYFCMYGFPL